MKMLKAKIWIILAVIVAVVIVAILFTIFKNGNYETVEVEKGYLIKTVEISGKVVAAQDVDLSFESRGTVKAIYVEPGDIVKVGDIVAELDSSEVDGEIREARANLDSASSKLDEIVGTTGSSEIDFKKDSLIKTLNKAYVNADGIIKNQIDIFFEDPSTRFPNFSSILKGYEVRKEIDDTRYELKFLLDDWKAETESLTISEVTYQNAYNAVDNLEEIEYFLSLIATKSYDFSPTGSVTQSQIDAYLTNVNTGRGTVASLKVEVNTALDNLRNVEAEVPVQNANINNSQATVDRLLSKRGKYVIRAPFNGIVTESDFEDGKVAESGQTIVSMISDLPLEIEVFIPEINIIGVDVGDKAKLKFDALGEDIETEAVVTRINPQATVNEGVVTYKTLINLTEPNKNLRSGMSVSTVIEKEIISDQIIIPSYVIREEEGGKFVEVTDNDFIEKVFIEILDSDNKGKVSVSGDLSSGDKLIIPAN